MVQSLIFLRLLRDVFFLSGGGWLLLCFGVGFALIIACRLVRGFRRLLRAVLVHRRAPVSCSPETATTQLEVEPVRDADQSTAHIDALFHDIEATNLTILDYAGAHATDDNGDPDGLISVSYLGQRAAVCAPNEYWITDAFHPHAEADDAVYNIVRHMCDYAKLCRESRPRVAYDDAEARAFALLANVPRELLTDPHLNAATIAAEHNVPAWELTRENIEYACNLFPTGTPNG